MRTLRCILLVVNAAFSAFWAIGGAAAQVMPSPDVVPQMGHNMIVYAVAFSPDNRMALSGGMDTTLKLWDVASGSELRTFRGHRGMVNAVAFLPDGGTALSASGDGTLRLWDVASAKELRSFAGHSGSVTSVVISQDGRTAISAGEDMTLKLWDIATGKELRTFKGHTGKIRTVSISPDGRFVLSGGEDKALHLWNLATGQMLLRFQEADTRINSVAFSPDGRTAVTGTGDMAAMAKGAASQKGQGGISPNGPGGFAFSMTPNIALWDVATGRQLRTFGMPMMEVSGVAFAKDGKTVFASTMIGVTYWDAASGKQLRAPSKTLLLAWSLALSSDGRSILSGGMGGVTLLDTASRDVTRTFGAGGSPIPAAGMPAGGFAGFAPPRRNRQGENRAPEESGGGKIPPSTMRTEHVSSVSLSADGRTILTSSLGFRLRLWDAATGKLLHSLADDRPIVRAAISADGRTILSCDSRTLKLWDVATGRVLRTFTGHDNAIHTVALSPDGRLALSGSLDKTAKLWDVATGQELHVLRGHTADVGSVAFSPDGRAALTASWDRTLKLWDVATGKELRTFTGHEKDILAAAYSPDGRSVVSGSADQTLKLWDVETGTELRTFAGAFGGVVSVAFSPDGRTLLAGYSDQTLRLWDVAAGKTLLSLKGHEGYVTAVSFSRNGRFAISGGSDGSIRVWDIKKGQEIARMLANSDGEWMTVTPEGFFTASHRDTGLLTIVRGNETTTSGQVHQSLFNPDLVHEALAGDPDGEASRAAQVINLGKVLDAGPPPSVTIVSHVGNSLSETGLVSVAARITDRGKGIGRIEWRVNGVTSGVSNAPANAGPHYDATHELALDPGVNQIEVIAYERRNLLASPPARTAISFEGAPDMAKPKLHILAIGINDYIDEGSPSGDAGFFPPLHLAVEDARAFAEEAKRAAAGLYGDVVVTYALDTDATPAKLDRLMERLGQNITPRDTFVFYAAAHGYSTNGRFYMIPQDYQGGADPQSLAARAIGQDRLQHWIANRIKAKKAIILLDTCEAGAAIDGHMTSRFAVPSSEAAMGRLHEATGRPVLTAAAAGEFALEGYKGHGVFTYALMEALHKGDSNHNGMIETTELATHVEKRVPEMALELNKNGGAVKGIATISMLTKRGEDDGKSDGKSKQSAHFGSTGEDFVLVGRLP